MSLSLEQPRLRGPGECSSPLRRQAKLSKLKIVDVECGSGGVSAESVLQDACARLRMTQDF